MLKNPATKYRPFIPVNLPDRAWPSKTIEHPPIWLSTDLRDGNQALIEPMNVQQKLQLFNLLVQIGFKEIEVAFPSASQTDFDFVRILIEQQLIPDDVVIQVLTPARENLIQRTFEALQGAKQAIVHLYNATSPIFREFVFGLDCAGTIQMAVSAAQLMKELSMQQPETAWQFQYSQRHLPQQNWSLPKIFVMPYWMYGNQRPSKSHHQPSSNGGSCNTQRICRPGGMDASTSNTTR